MDLKYISFNRTYLVLKGGLRPETLPTVGAFNRTYLVLKVERVLALTDELQETFNRTYLVLKDTVRYVWGYDRVPFNRTYLVLKGLSHTNKILWISSFNRTYLVLKVSHAIRSILTRRNF